VFSLIAAAINTRGSITHDHPPGKIPLFSGLLHILIIGHIYIHIPKHMACEEAKSAMVPEMPEPQKCRNTRTRCRPRLQQKGKR